MSSYNIRPLDVVIACASQHNHILRLTLSHLQRYVNVNRVFIISPYKNLNNIRELIGNNIIFIDEDAVIPGMTMGELRKLDIIGFPAAAGWYYQQFLKMSFAFIEENEPYYLIWDADTIPLKHLKFFNEKGHMIFVKSDEYHEPYFRNYKNLLREEPNRKFSFISQHIIVNKTMMREMLEKIERNFEGNEIWAWKIIKNLEQCGNNLFSEYETYGHYVKNHYPNRCSFVEIPWARNGTKLASFHPNQSSLNKLGEEFYYAAFERYHSPIRSLIMK